MTLNMHLNEAEYQSILADQNKTNVLFRKMVAVRNYTQNYVAYCQEVVDKLSSFLDKGIREFNQKVEAEMLQLKQRYPDKVEKVGGMAGGSDLILDWRIKDNNLKIRFMMDVYDNYWRTLLTNYLFSEQNMLVWMRNIYSFAKKIAWEFGLDGNFEIAVYEHLKEAIVAAQTEIKESKEDFFKQHFPKELKVIIDKNNEIIKDAERMMIWTKRLSTILLDVVIHLKNIVGTVEKIEVLAGGSFRQESQHYGTEAVNEDLFKKHAVELKKYFESLVKEFEAVKKIIRVRRPAAKETRLVREMARDEEQIAQEIKHFEESMKKAA